MPPADRAISEVSSDPRAACRVCRIAIRHPDFGQVPKSHEPCNFRCISAKTRQSWEAQSLQKPQVDPSSSAFKRTSRPLESCTAALSPPLEFCNVRKLWQYRAIGALGTRGRWFAARKE